jgi:ribosomal-protein-alanine N-acetyltransferase
VLIEGHRIYMVRFERKHLDNPAYFKWLRDLEVVRYIGRDELLAGIPFSEVERYVEQLWANENCYFLAVYHSESKNFIGTAKINFFNERFRRSGLADIGIMLGDRDSWGQGLGTDVLRNLSKFAFEQLGARKLSAGAMSPNTAIVKAFLRIGYLEEGRLRQHLLIENEYCDHVLLGCLKGELR